jgi:hypothetical protein
MSGKESVEQVTKTETRDQMGKVHVKGQTIPVKLKITETHYESGRKDCRVGVPRLGLKAKKKS